MLPSYHGLPSEDPLSFIRDFYSIVGQMPLQGLNEDQLRIRCFPYCLKDMAKAWLTSLIPDSLHTWDEVFHKFMAKYYIHQKTTTLRQKLATFYQQEGEPFHEVWERFKQLQMEYPHHHYSTGLLNQFFYDGMTVESQCMIDTAVGGTVGVKTATEINELFEMMGANSQQKSVRGNMRKGVVQGVSESSSLALQVERMQGDIQKLLNGGSLNQNQKAQCNACGEYGHVQN